MRHIANTPAGRLAKTQSDLVKLAMKRSPMSEENMQHPVCEIGFSEYGENGIERMSPQTFVGAVSSIMKARPSAHLFDVIPEVPYDETTVLDHSAEVYSMTVEQKALFLKEEFLRRPRMVGFRYELSGVSTVPETEEPGKNASVSITIYETKDGLEDTCVPVSIRVRYRNL